MRLNILISLILILLPLKISKAEDLSPINVGHMIEANKCHVEIKELLNLWGAQKGSWQGLLADAGTLVYVKPTNMFAVWIKLQKNDENLELSKIAPTNITQVKFQANCLKQLSAVTSPYKSIPKNIIDDEKLFSLINKNSTGLIYSWSPHMGLSIKGLATMQGLAHQMKLPLIVLLDGSADVSLAKRRLNEEHVKLDEILIGQSMDLYFRRTHLHYPNLIVFKNGKVVDGMLPGLSNDEQYEAFIKAQVSK